MLFKIFSLKLNKVNFAKHLIIFYNNDKIYKEICCCNIIITIFATQIQSEEIVVFITTQFCQNEKTHFNTHTIMEKIQTYNLKLSHKYNQF